MGVMSPSDGTYDLPELATRSGVSIRTVRYYIQQGLLPSPEARGPGAHYTEEHLDRLLRIKRLQRDHLPLAEIRRLLDSSASEGKPPATAKDYISEVLRGETSTHLPEGPAILVGRGRSTRVMDATLSVSEEAISYDSTATSSQSIANKPPTRSQWERLTLAQDIELHVRRPLSRHLNKKLERLLESAREILKEDE